MTTKTGNLGKVEAKLILQPVHGITGSTGEDLNEVVPSKIPSLAQRDETRQHQATELTERLVSSKKILALSGIPASC